VPVTERGPSPPGGWDCVTWTPAGGWDPQAEATWEAIGGKQNGGRRTDEGGKFAKLGAICSHSGR
jgi:hypothetical protein